MNLLAEVADKIISTGQVWAVMGVVSAAVGAIAFASRRAAMLVAIAISALGCVFTLSFLDDAVLGEAVLQERGWSSFATKMATCLLPVATAVVAMLWRKRFHRDATGFEVVPQSSDEWLGASP